MVRVRRLSEENHRETLRDFLCDYEDEFVPPLTARSGVEEWDDDEPGESLDPFLDDCFDQEVIGAFNGDGELIGITVYDYGFFHALPQEMNPCVYVTITLVAEDYRQQGVNQRISTEVYNHALELSGKQNIQSMAFRTWSTNEGGKALMEKYNFKEMYRIEDDRGEGVDSIYYAAQLEDIPNPAEL